MHRILNVKG